MNSQCLLISPPGEMNVFPRGIMEIATFLNTHGCRTTVLPLGYYYRGTYRTDECGYISDKINPGEFYDIIAQEIQTKHPAVIGISNVYTSDYADCIEIARLCKKIKPNVITVMGGQHATFLDRESLETPELDIVVRGEGEWALLDIIRAVNSGRGLETVAGTTLRVNGQVHRNPPRPFGNLADIPPTDFGLLPEKFVQTAQINGILTRGCAYHCVYCVEKKFWRYPRPYRVEKVVREMQTLQADYGTQMIGFEESMLDMRHKSFSSLMAAIAEADITLPPDFSMPTRIDTVTADGIRMLKRAGGKILCAGLENFSPRVLEMMNKKQDYQGIIAGCRKLRDADIWLNAYWLVGHPGDNPVEAAATHTHFRDFCERGLINSGHAFIFVPYPGTDFFDHPARYGIRITTYDWKKWQRWTDNPVSHLEDFSAAEIEKAWQAAMRLLKTYRRLNSFLLANHAKTA